MIYLTRLSGSVFALNSDLIERVDSTPDTVVTLVDGKKYVVTEPLEDVVDAIREHRGEVIAISTRLELAPAPHEQSHERHRAPVLGTVTPHPALNADRRES